MFNDASCINDMKNLETVCNTKPNPCSWRGKLLMLEVSSDMVELLFEIVPIVIPCMYVCRLNCFKVLVLGDTLTVADKKTFTFTFHSTGKKQEQKQF